MTDQPVSVSAAPRGRATRALPRRRAEPIRAVAGTGRRATTALPWLAWFAALGLLVTGTGNLIVLAAALTSCVAAAALGRRDRRPLFVAAAGVAMALVAVWVLWSVLLQRGGDGTVLWLLPAWNPSSGGSFGGPVTIAQLLYGLARALRAAAIGLMAGLLGQQVAAAGWLTLADATLGRGAGLLAPLCCAGDAYLTRRTARARALAGGLRLRGGSGGLADLALASREAAQDWAALTTNDRGGWRGVVGLGGQAGLMAGWAVGVLPAGQSLTGLTPPELTVAWLAVAIATGLAFHPRQAAGLRPAAADLPALLSAVLLLTAWFGRELTGEWLVLDPLADEWLPVPWLTLGALAVLPLGLLVGGGRR